MKANYRMGFNNNPYNTYSLLFIKLHLRNLF